MVASTFDTLAYAKKLREAGFTEQQAEVQAEALWAVVDENLATKTDLKELETALRHDVAELKTELKLAVAESKAETLKWVAGLLVAQASLIVAAIKLL